MNRRRVLAVVGALVLTLFGTFVLIAYVNAAENRAQEGADLVGILVAREEIPAGTSAAELAGSGSVARKEVPASARADDAVTDLSGLGDQVTLERILADEPIVARHFGDAVAAQRAGGTGELEEGREIITIALEAQRALGGELAAGDLVGVIVSLEGASSNSDEATTFEQTADGPVTQMVLANIRVTDVTGTDAESVPTNQANQAVGVSLDVDQSDAEVIAFGMEFGRVWLTRQADGIRPNGPPQTRDSVLGRGER